MYLDAGAAPRTARKHLVGDQAAAIARLTPPDAIVGELSLVLLKEVHDRKRHQTGRGHGQQCRLQTVEETSLHERIILPEFDLARSLP